ncbi:hypothetical protein Tco_0423706, partial [Tanacetum coccineum]
MHDNLHGSVSGQQLRDVAHRLVVIRNHPSALEIYQNKLLETGQATKEDIDRIQNKVTSIFNDELLASKDYVTSKRDW